MAEQNSNHIIGTGIDLVENERMTEMLSRWHGKFKDRVFLPEEQAYCESKSDPNMHYAARFAVKEAVSKALGTGLGTHVNLLDIETVRDNKTGAPSVKLSARAGKLMDSMGAGNILISLSHTKNYSVAHAIVERKKNHRSTRMNTEKIPS